MLNNNKISLRAPEPEDLDILYKWENNTELWKYGSTLSPISKYTLKKYIEDSHLSLFEAGQLRLIIIENTSKEVVGAVDLFDLDIFHKRVAIGILIDPNFQKKGLARASLELMTDYCFNFLHLHQVYAHVPIDNHPSLILFTQCGFEQTGVLKEWLHTENEFSDVAIFQKIKL